MSMKEQAYAYIDAHRDGMMKMWEDFVMTESGSANKADVDGLIARAADILTGMGGKTRIVEFPNAGNALVSEFGDCANKPFVVFVGHLDTVFSDPGETQRRCSATRAKPKGAPLPLKTAGLTGRACWI